MKYLMLIRHAKSDWNDPGLSDHDRPLNERGLRTAPVMGRFLSKTYLGANGTPAVLPRIDRVVSSTAVRAQSTARLLVEALQLDTTQLLLEESAYLAEPDTLLELSHLLESAWKHVILVGHNPGISEFANRLLARGAIGDMPTGAAALLELPVDQWSQIGWHQSRLVGFVTPRLIEKRFMGEVMGV